MAVLIEKLDELGLSEYHRALVAEGFDTWEIVLDITESDLTSLGVKLGHRRKLQRAIAAWRSQSGEAPLAISPHVQGQTADGEARNQEEEGDGRPAELQNLSAPNPPTKRKYRRHPKPDENAPNRPPSSYVIFSNHVRERLKGGPHTFTDIAKLVGERWQALSPEARQACDREASAAKEKYYRDLTEYKKTPQYEQYQAYLAEFKRKHASKQGGKDDKRSKSDADSAVSRPGSGDMSGSNRVALFNKPGRHHHHHHPDAWESGDVNSSGGQYPASTATSPVTGRPFPSIDSPQFPEGFPSASTSPRSVASFKDPMQTISLYSANDGRDRLHNLSPMSPSSAPHLAGASPSSVTLPPFSHAYDTSLRRQFLHHGTGTHVPPLLRQDSSVASVPSLTHTDTTLSASSDSRSRRSSYMSTSIPPSHLPPIDAPKSLRTLPQPVPTTLPSPMEHAKSGLPTRTPPSRMSGSADKPAGISALLIAAGVEREGSDPSPPTVDPPP